MRRPLFAMIIVVMSKIFWGAPSEAGALQLPDKLCEEIEFKVPVKIKNRPNAIQKKIEEIGQSRKESNARFLLEYFSTSGEGKARKGVSFGDCEFLIRRQMLGGNVKADVLMLETRVRRDGKLVTRQDPILVEDLGDYQHVYKGDEPGRAPDSEFALPKACVDKRCRSPWPSNEELRKGCDQEMRFSVYTPPEESSRKTTSIQFESQNGSTVLDVKVRTEIKNRESEAIRKAVEPDVPEAEKELRREGYRISFSTMKECENVRKGLTGATTIHHELFACGQLENGRYTLFAGPDTKLRAARLLDTYTCVPEDQKMKAMADSKTAAKTNPQPKPILPQNSRPSSGTR